MTTPQQPWWRGARGDNVLNVYRLDSFTATTATLTEIGYDDDSGGGPHASNALLSVALTAGQDCFVRVAGWAVVGAAGGRAPACRRLHRCAP